MRKFLVFCTGILLSCQCILAQAPQKSASAEIYHALQKLNFLGNALYIAAHPDDENTRLISYLSNHVKAKTGYLSITRGDGGQNLIGPELRELLGVLRTQELLAARRVDGGSQFFTRAVDFGYSKHPKETLEIWDKEAVLSDVVWVIRNFKPDVIINRFDHRTPGSTHGHHTSSAILSMEAFDLAADPAAYPEQLSATETWQPSRAFFNTSWWFYGSEENFEKADKSKLLSLDVGVYYPLKGLSNNEIAALASSQHLCQGFGRRSDRGSQDEFIELLKGTMPPGKTDIFEGINTTWSRLEGGASVGEILYAVEASFNFTDPAEHLPQLLEAYQRLKALDDNHWKTQKTAELEALISAVCGLHLEANATVAEAYPGDTIGLEIELLNRSDAKVVLNAVRIGPETGYTKPLPLANNQKKTMDLRLPVPEDAPYTSPYWLTEKGGLGMYKVADRQLIGKPETPAAFEATFDLQINGTALTLKSPVMHKFARPDKGELVQPFNILPRATVRFNDPVLIFDSGEARQITVSVKAHSDGVQGEVNLLAGSGWTVTDPVQKLEIAKKGDEKTFVFTLLPPDGESEIMLRPQVTLGDKTLSSELVTIGYDHIPEQSVLLPAEAKAVRLNIEKTGDRVGYIAGAGDNIPESLEQIVYQVRRIDPSTIEQGSLQGYDAVVLGIRAYNVVDGLKFKQPFLLDYVKNGGTLIVQYNTVWRNNLGVDNLAPYPLQLSRDRVVDENSEVRILEPGHALMTYPNHIPPADFKGWVQERGLYFPDAWDSAFTPILSMHDDGETPKNGSLLVAPYGKGYYIYTGLSFFRELPAGVPGAYKIFANMLSIGTQKEQHDKVVKG